MAGVRSGRQIEVEAGVLVRVQRFLRQRAARDRFQALMEEFRQRKRDEVLAATKLQALGRMRRGQRAHAAVRSALQSLFNKHVSVAKRLQAVYRGRIGRRLSELLQRQYVPCCR